MTAPLLPRSTPPCRTRPGSGTTGSAARTTTPSTGRPATSIREVFPEIVDIARASRAFLARAVRYLAGEAGIRQFLDIGTGLPTADNTHEVAQRVAPDARIVYVDNDPLVLVHARALLTSTPEGATDYIDADLRDPETILAAAARTLDFAQPVALMLMGILGHVADDDEARSIVKRLLDAPAVRQLPGPQRRHQRHQRGGRRRPSDATTRAAPSPTTCAAPSRSPASSTGLELVEPGVVSRPAVAARAPTRPAPPPRSTRSAGSAASHSRYPTAARRQCRPTSGCVRQRLRQGIANLLLRNPPRAGAAIASRSTTRASNSVR